jgi:predicted MPP superfamily phosphohydrolase
MQGNGPFFPILLIFVLIFVMNWYSFQGLKVLFDSIEHNFLRKLLKTLYWTIPYLSLFLTVYGLANMSKNNGLGYWGAIGFNSLITLFFVQLTIIIVVFGGDVYRGLVGVVNYVQSIGKPTPEGHAYIPERRKFIAQLALLVAAVPFASFVYGIVKGKYNYKLHKHILTFKDLPEAFDGFTITQISDVHAGSLNDHEAVALGIDLINEQKSDLFLFTGDLVNNNAEEFEPWINAFRKIKAPYGQFSVLGNHDYGDYRDWPSKEAKINNHLGIIKHHENAGFKLLRDEHVKIEKDGQAISLIGVQNWGHGFIKMGDLNRALEGVNKNDFKILMSHDPTHFEHVVKTHDTHIHLTLAGHTHGMQMGVEFPWLKWSPIKYRYPKWAGLYQENDRFLHINRGFGFLGFGGRVGIWPEVTLIELRKG